MQERGMQEMRDAGKKGCRKRGMTHHDGKEEGGNQDWRDTRKMGFGTRGIQDWGDTGNKGYRK